MPLTMQWIINKNSDELKKKNKKPQKTVDSYQVKT